MQDEKNWAAVVNDLGKEFAGLIKRTLFIGLIAAAIWFFGPAEAKVVAQKAIDLYVKLVKGVAAWDKAALLWMHRWLNGPLWGKPGKKVPWYRRRKIHLIALPTVYLGLVMLAYIKTPAAYAPYVIIFPIAVGFMATCAAALFGFFVWAVLALGDLGVDLVQRPVIAGISGVGAAVRQVLSDEEKLPAAAPIKPVVPTAAIRDGGAKFAYGLVMAVASFVFWNLAFKSMIVFGALYVLAFGITALVATGKLGGFVMRKGIELYYRLLALALVIGAILAVIGASLPKTYRAISSGSGLDSALASWFGSILTVFGRVWNGFGAGSQVGDVIQVGIFLLIVLAVIGFMQRILRMPVHKVGEAVTEEETRRGGALVPVLMMLVIVGTALGAYLVYRAEHPEPPATAAASPVAPSGPTTHTVVVVNTVPTPAVSQPRPAPTTGRSSPRGGSYALAQARYCPSTASAVGTAGPSSRDFEVACRGEALASGIPLP